MSFSTEEVCLKNTHHIIGTKFWVNNIIIKHDLALLALNRVKQF